MKVFTNKPEEEDALKASEADHSLSYCVQRWLERTPGLQPEGFNFPQKFKEAVEAIFDKELKRIEVSLFTISNVSCLFMCLHIFSKRRMKRNELT